jgi:hypothetical protein
MPKTVYETYGPDSTYYRPPNRRRHQVFPPTPLAQMAEILVMDYADEGQWRNGGNRVRNFYIDFHFIYTPQRGPPPFIVKVSVH